MKPGRRKECQGGIEPAQRREPTVKHGNVIKNVQYCSRRLEGDPMLFEIVVNKQGPAKGGRRYMFQNSSQCPYNPSARHTHIPSSPIERCKFASRGAGGQDLRAFRRGYAAACSLRLPFPRSLCLPLRRLWLRTASVSGQTPSADREHGSEHLEVRPETQLSGPIQTLNGMSRT